MTNEKYKEVLIKSILLKDEKLGEEKLEKFSLEDLETMLEVLNKTKEENPKKPAKTLWLQNRSGGYSPKVTLPKEWVLELGITQKEWYATLEFDRENKQIIFRKGKKLEGMGNDKEMK